MIEKTLTQRIEDAKKGQMVVVPLEEVLEFIKQNDDRYWSKKDIAEYLGVSESTVMRNLVPDPRFPKSITTKQGGTASSKRWLASEVKSAIQLINR